MRMLNGICAGKHLSIQFTDIIHNTQNRTQHTGKKVKVSDPRVRVCVLSLKSRCPPSKRTDTTYTDQLSTFVAKRPEDTNKKKPHRNRKYERTQLAISERSRTFTDRTACAQANKPHTPNPARNVHSNCTAKTAENKQRRTICNIN